MMKMAHRKTKERFSAQSQNLAKAPLPKSPSANWRFLCLEVLELKVSQSADDRRRFCFCCGLAAVLSFSLIEVPNDPTLLFRDGPKGMNPSLDFLA